MYYQIAFKNGEGVESKINLINKDDANAKWRELHKNEANTHFSHYVKTMAVYVVFGRKAEARETIKTSRDNGRPVPKYLYQDWERHTPGEEVLVDARGVLKIATVYSCDEIETSAMKQLYRGTVKPVIILNREQKQEW